MKRDGPVLEMNAARAQVSRGGQARGAAPRSAAADLCGSCAEFVGVEDAGYVVKRHPGVVLEGCARGVEVVERAGNLEYRGAGREPGRGDGDPVVFHGDGEVDGERNGLAMRERKVQRLDRDRAAVAWTAPLVREACRQVAALRIERRAPARIDLEPAVAQTEAVDRELENVVYRVALSFDLRFGNVGAAVGIHDQRYARLLHVERLNIDIALERRDDLQSDRDGRRAEQGRLLGGLRAVQGEAADFGAHRPPVEAERPDVHAAPGRGLDGRDDAGADLLEKPRASDYENDRDCREEHEGREGRERDSELAPPAHRNASSRNTISVRARDSAIQAATCWSTRSSVSLAAILSRNSSIVNVAPGFAAFAAGSTVSWKYSLTSWSRICTAGRKRTPMKPRNRRCQRSSCLTSASETPAAVRARR